MKSSLKSHTEISYAYSLGETTVNKKTNAYLDIELRYIDLKIKKTAHNYFYKPGDELKYSIIITNVGNHLAEEMFVVDDIRNLTFIENSCLVVKDGVILDNINPKINDNHLTFDIGNVDPNSTVIINYKAYANEEINLDEPLSNQASVYAKRVNRIDSNLVNIEQKFAQISTTKNCSKQYVYNHDLLDIYLYLKNTGNISAKNIKISEKLPNGFVLSDEESILLNDMPYENFEYNLEQNTLTIFIDELTSNSESKITIKGQIQIK